MEMGNETTFLSQHINTLHVEIFRKNMQNLPRYSPAAPDFLNLLQWRPLVTVASQCSGRIACFPV